MCTHIGKASFAIDIPRLKSGETLGKDINIGKVEVLKLTVSVPREGGVWSQIFFTEKFRAPPLSRNDEPRESRSDFLAVHCGGGGI